MATDFSREVPVRRSLSVSFSELYSKYLNHVANFPENANIVESSVRLLSYATAGRGTAGSVLCELFYSLSKVLTTFHDYVLRCKAGLSVHRSSTVEKLKYALSILDSVEVLVEISAQAMFSDRTRWLVVFALQMIKALLKLAVLRLDRNSLGTYPYVEPLLRSELSQQQNDAMETAWNSSGGNSQNGGLATSSDTTLPGQQSFKLGHGRRMRSLDTAPHMMARDWKVPPAASADAEIRGEKAQVPLKSTQLKAELLHVARPLVHLIASAAFGLKSWKSFSVAAAIDSASLYLHSKCRLTSLSGQEEIKRRRTLLLLYLLRSPLYEKLTKAKVEACLSAVSRTVPLARFAVEPLSQYLPIWQDTYSYSWAS